MSKRKCVFTGMSAILKNKVIPKTCSEDVSHNWANGVPCSSEYAKIKDSRMPDKLELEAVEVFQFLETSRLWVDFYEDKLLKIQEELRKRLPEKPKMSNRKKKSIEKAINLKEVLEQVDKHIDEVLDKESKGLWDK